MSQRQPSSLPSQLEPNPRESVNAITLRSYKGYDDPTMPELKSNEVFIENRQAPKKEAPNKGGFK